MTISELMSELRESLDRFGDMQVIYFDGAVAHEPEVFVGTHRTGNRVFIAQLPKGAKTLAASMKTDTIRERGQGETEAEVVYYSLTPDIPIGAAIHNRALIGNETRLWGLTTIVKVEGRSPDTGAQYLYILALAGPHSTFRLVYKLNLWHPTLPAAADSPTGAERERDNTQAVAYMLQYAAAVEAVTGAEQEPPKAQTFEEIMAEDARRAAEFQAGTEQEPPKPFRKAEPGEPTPLYPDAATAERIACIADIEAAFYGDGRITDRYDIMNFILDRINRRGNA